MPTIAEQRARIAEIASRMIARNPGNAGAIMQQLKDAGLDISGNPIGAQPPATTPFGGRPPTPPPTGFPPASTGLTAADTAIPFGGSGGYPNSLRAMADRSDPNQAPDFRSRLSDARMLQGSATPMPGLAIPSTNPTAQVQGQLPGNFMSPGNLPRPRPYESPVATRPEGPPSGFPAAPQPYNMARPEGPPGGFPAATPFGGNMPMPRQTAALGSGERSPIPGLPQPRPPEMGPPMPGSTPPPGTFAPPSAMASRFGDQSPMASGAFRGGMPLGPVPGPGMSAPPSALASRLGGMPPLPGGSFSGGPPPPMAAGPTPLQLEAARDQVRQMASLPQVAPPKSLMPIETTPASTMSNPLQRTPLNLAAGAGATALPLGSTSLPFATTSPSPASVAQRTADILGPLPPGAGTGAPIRSVQQPLIGVPPASGTVPPVGPVPGQDLPAPSPVGIPSMLASVGPPNPARMEVVANYNQPPPGMALPPGVTQQDVGRLGFGATNIDPGKAPVQRHGSNTGKYAGAALGAVKGLAGGPVGAAVGGFLGYQGGKRVGGLLGDRDFGLGARFTNRNYPQGVVANPPAIMDMGVPPITPPAQTPIMQAGTGGGIFGQGRSMIGGAASKILSAVRSGKMPLEAAAKALGMPTASLRDSLGSMGSGGHGMGGMGGYGGGGYGGGSYQGGSYGGFGGSRINEGIGQRFGNR